MGLNIKNEAVERLAAEVASLAGENKTQAIHGALLDRREKLILLRGGKDRRERLGKALREKIWPLIPARFRGRKPMSKKEMDKLVGYGPHGY